MNRLVDADPFPVVLSYLQGLPALQAELGGPDRVGADHVPPYPRLRVRPAPGGSDDDLQWLVSQAVRLEALDSTDAPVGDQQLRRILYTALGALRQLPEQPAVPDQPVISWVKSATSGQPLPEADGRNRWFAVVHIGSHPG